MVKTDFFKYIAFSVYLALANSISNNNNMLVFFTIPDFSHFSCKNALLLFLFLFLVIE